jgi:hypothetical protein
MIQIFNCIKSSHAKTGISVNVVVRKDQALTKRILEEGKGLHRRSVYYS